MELLPYWHIISALLFAALHKMAKDKLTRITSLERVELLEMLDTANDAVISTDSEQIIVFFNLGAEEIFGYRSDEIVGQSLSVLIPESARQSHDHHMKDFGKTKVRSRLMGQRSEISGLRKSGYIFPAEASISQFKVEGKRIYTVFLRDITSRKRTEERLQASLQEKEVLLKEIHHRVKNNLQIISSLLRLQARKNTDPAAREVLNESQNRVGSIALIHEMLYQASDLARVDFREYVNALVSNLMRSYGTGTNVTVEVETGGLELDLDTAIPCGLIINELLSNSFKHGFKAGADSKVTILLQQEQPKHLRLTVSDNGIGLPEGFDYMESRTLGLRLVANLANQLGGEIEIDGSDGTNISISFDEPQIEVWPA